MEQETLYTAAKWQILKALAKSNKSPIELAQLSNTSTSNISQSLRFLELAGIVKSERISNRDKGQPRVVYSLAKDKAYFIITSHNFVEKKEVNLNKRKKIILKIWLYENEAIHPFLEKAIQNIENQLHKINGIFLDTSNMNETKLLILTKESEKIVFKESIIEYQGTIRKIKYEVTNNSKIQSATNLYAIYDPQYLFGEDT